MISPIYTKTIINVGNDILIAGPVPMSSNAKKDTEDSAEVLTSLKLTQSGQLLSVQAEIRQEKCYTPNIRICTMEKSSLRATTDH